MEVATSLVLVSRHRLTTNGLRALFDKECVFRVLAELGDCPDSLQKLQRIAPDFVIVDVIARSPTGLSLVRRVREHASRSAIVALSMCTDPPYVSQALQYGASAYLLKTETFPSLLHALHEVRQGRKYLSPGLDVARIRRQASAARQADPFECLTTRERQVLQLAAEGRTNAQIAASLDISRRTAETHRANIYKKLRVDGQADLLAFALRRGLLTREC